MSDLLYLSNSELNSEASKDPEDVNGPKDTLKNLIRSPIVLETYSDYPRSIDTYYRQHESYVRGNHEVSRPEPRRQSEMFDTSYYLKKYLREDTSKFEKETLLPPITFSNETDRASFDSTSTFCYTGSSSIERTSQILYKVTGDTPEMLKSSPSYQIRSSPSYQIKSSPSYQLKGSPSYQIKGSPTYQIKNSPSYRIKSSPSNHTPKKETKAENRVTRYKLNEDLFDLSTTFSSSAPSSPKEPYKRPRSPSLNPSPNQKSKKPTRSKSGCWTCRLRHKSCPEEHPMCTECKRLKLVCDYSTIKPLYMTDRQAMSQKLAEIRLKTTDLKRAKMSSRMKQRSSTQ